MILEAERKKPVKRHGRKRIYGPEVEKELVKIWRIMDYPCGKRLAAMLPWLVPKLEHHGELIPSPEVREKLEGAFRSHHRPDAFGQEEADTAQGPQRHEARDTFEAEDPCADVRRLGRCQAGLHRDGHGRPRGRQPQRRICLDPESHRR